MSTRPGACRCRVLQPRLCSRRQECRAHCWRQVEEKQGGEGADGVVAHDDGGVAPRSRRLISREAASMERTPAGSHGGLGGACCPCREGCPPTQNHAPSVKGGVPRDGGDAGRAGFTREEGRVKRARDERPEGAAAEGVFFEDAADEDSGLVDGGGQGDSAVVVGLVLQVGVGEPDAGRGKRAGSG